MFNLSETLTLTLGCSSDADYLQNRGGFSCQFPMSLVVCGDDVSRGLFPVIGWKMAANTTIVPWLIERVKPLLFQAPIHQVTIIFQPTRIQDLLEWACSENRSVLCPLIKNYEIFLSTAVGFHGNRKLSSAGSIMNGGNVFRSTIDHEIVSGVCFPQIMFTSVFVAHLILSHCECVWTQSWTMKAVVASPVRVWVWVWVRVLVPIPVPAPILILVQVLVWRLHAGEPAVLVSIDCVRHCRTLTSWLYAHEAETGGWLKGQRSAQQLSTPRPSGPRF